MSPPDLDERVAFALGLLLGLAFGWVLGWMRGYRIGRREGVGYFLRRIG